jgi:hypothetical protein
MPCPPPAHLLHARLKLRDEAVQPVDVAADALALGAGGVEAALRVGKGLVDGLRCMRGRKRRGEVEVRFLGDWGWL